MTVVELLQFCVALTHIPTLQHAIIAVAGSSSFRARPSVAFAPEPSHLHSKDTVLGSPLLSGARSPEPGIMRPKASTTIGKGKGSL